MKRVVVAFGTRPEANKMVPVVFALRAQAGLDPLILTTGQHREQLDSTLELFDLHPRYRPQRHDGAANLARFDEQNR